MRRYQEHRWEQRSCFSPLSASSPSAQAPSTKTMASAKKENGILSGTTPLWLQF